MVVSGPDPGRCNRCRCIGQKKIDGAFIGQIFTANNEKTTLCENTRLIVHKFQQS